MKRRVAGNVGAALARALTIGLAASLGYAIAVYHPFFRSSVMSRAKIIWDCLIVAYWVLPFPFYLLIFDLKPRKRFDTGSKPLQMLALLRRIAAKRKKPEVRVFGSFHARLSMLSLLVKIYYLPIMTTFLVDHYMFFANWFSKSVSIADLTAGDWLTGIGYRLLFQSIFVLDTAIFSFGYAVELPALRSRIRSVEPTLLGWAVTLSCYPPLNVATDIVLGRAYSKTVLSFWLAAGSNVIIISCFLVYVWASVALLFKASNLTHRGIVVHGPYRYIRHPAYAAKNLAWWFEWLPSLTNPANLVSMIGWNAIYILRAITEERHLGKDPVYREYCRKVKYRFIPGLI